MTETTPEPAPSPPESGNVWQKEPVAIALAGLDGVVVAGLAMADALDWVSLQPEQTAAVSAFVVAISTVIGAVLRAAVYSPATVAALTEPPDSAPRVLP